MILGGLQSFSTDVQNAALVNEFKGNLFEFLVASFLARQALLEEDFLLSLPNGFREQLAFYESWMRKNSPAIIKALPSLAEKTAMRLMDELPHPIASVKLIGKIAAASGMDHYAEADLLLKLDKQECALPVSLKLCKGNAFVNTKSAGIKTFVSKYFSSFKQSTSLQQELNQKVDFYFDCMGRSLYDLADLEWNGRFGSEWTNAGYSELPGGLSREMNEILVQYYARTIDECYKLLHSFYSEDKEQFAYCLYPLIGLTNPKQWVVSCFHREIGEKTHQLDSILVENATSFDFSSISLGELKSGISSFEVFFPNQILQIRVKPMNKFTTAGLKVNCSIKSLQHNMNREDN